ncbi:MAG: DUF4157 domain-containing protein [Caldilineales bacterium]
MTYSRRPRQEEPGSLPGSGEREQAGALGRARIPAWARAAGKEPPAHLLDASKDNAEAVETRLGEGRPLDAAVKGRMESAFGADFSGVRVHIDTQAAGLSDSLDARAFTIGRQVAFGAGQYRPGTPVGDALIAHELAHVMQQRAATHAGSAGDRALEADASQATIGALAATATGAQRAGMRTAPALRSGLRLQRCEKKKEEAAGKDPKLLADFAAKFPDAAKLIRGDATAMKFVTEAQAAGVEFGGYAEEGPAKTAWPYTIGNKVYVPKARTDDVLALNALLFEINNAMRAPKFQELATEAAKGTKGTLTAEQYAYKVVEQEVEGMLRLGEIWFEMRKGKEKEWSKYDNEFYQAEYTAYKAGKKSKDDIIKDVLSRTYPAGVNKGKTVKQTYMEQYNSLSGGK